MEKSSKIVGILLLSVVFALTSACFLFLHFNLSMLQFLGIYSGIGSSCMLGLALITAQIKGNCETTTNVDAQQETTHTHMRSTTGIT